MLKPNQVIEAPAEEVGVLVKAGFADTNREAVKYCLDRPGAEIVSFSDDSQETVSSVDGDPEVSDSDIGGGDTAVK